MERLLKLHETIGSLAWTMPELLELPEVARSLDGGTRRSKVIVARFEEFLEANPNTSLYLTEVCAAVGAAERTLRAACQEHLGMGPIRYLTLRRMHLVNRALARAASSMATVTHVATDHGFWELGRFAAAYRELFGEPPSATLQRPPDCRLVKIDRTSPIAV